ncbi:hypothetical protein BDZ88DRAFT_508693 [Geranomyces variabilis]|nr:hypothetical protein BDZ88DRAFT_508693 [Geranomyces variabilis]KAJ3135884.1 hypothetical protein HDU90_003625 [Geranomyces variabilis]
MVQRIWTSECEVASRGVYTSYCSYSVPGVHALSIRPPQLSTPPLFPLRLRLFSTANAMTQPTSSDAASAPAILDLLGQITAHLEKDWLAPRVFSVQRDNQAENGQGKLDEERKSAFEALMESAAHKFMLGDLLLRVLCANGDHTVEFELIMQRTDLTPETLVVTQGTDYASRAVKKAGFKRWLNVSMYLRSLVDAKFLPDPKMSGSTTVKSVAAKWFSEHRTKLKLPKRRRKPAFEERMKLWKAWFGDRQAVRCPMCVRDQHQLARPQAKHKDVEEQEGAGAGFVIGHIHAFVRGGACETWNFVPICHSCNLDMGTEMLIDWCATSKPESLAPLCEKIFEQLAQQIKGVLGIQTEVDMVEKLWGKDSAVRCVKDETMKMLQGKLTANAARREVIALRGRSEKFESDLSEITNRLDDLEDLEARIEQLEQVERDEKTKREELEARIKQLEQVVDDEKTKREELEARIKRIEDKQ